VTLVDTSAWVEFLRGTKSAACNQVAALIAGDAPMATTEVVVMEVLAGARDEVHHQRLRRLLRRCDLLALNGLDDYERAAEVYRTCRRAGETIRKLTDCLIAVVALRTDTPVLHQDADFTAIARQLPLRIAGEEGVAERG
jgi:predicted nucleic acid-binding protein